MGFRLEFERIGIRKWVFLWKIGRRQHEQRGRWMNKRIGRKKRRKGNEFFISILILILILIFRKFNRNNYMLWVHCIFVRFLTGEGYLDNQNQTTLLTTFFPFFLLDKSNRERKRKRENKSIMRVWERKLSQKLFKSDCSNIISHIFIPFKMINMKCKFLDTLEFSWIHVPRKKNLF